MLTETLDQVSNKETWTETIELFDDDGDALFQFDDESTWPDEITIKVRDPASKRTVLSGSLTGGDIDIVDDGTISFSFSAAAMGALCAKTYDIGCLLTTDSVVSQVILGSLPVIEGL